MAKKKTLEAEAPAKIKGHEMPPTEEMTPNVTLVPKTEEDETVVITENKQPMKLIDVSEFRAIGALQELNRLYLHPMGLALVVQADEDGRERILGIADGRDDPQGFVFGDPVSPLKAWTFDSLLKHGKQQRKKSLGFDVEPLPKITKDDLQVGKIFRAKNPKIVVGQGQRLLGFNDRVITWVGINSVQYNSHEVPVGTRFPVVKMVNFLNWASFEVIP